MSLTPSDYEGSPVFEVTIFENDKATEIRRFESLAEAEAFAEQWSDNVPGAHHTIEHLTQDHTAWEVAAAETALDDDDVRVPLSDHERYVT